MAQRRATLSPLPTHLIEALDNVFALKPTDESQQAAKPEIIRALRTALDARRQRIVISESAVGAVKWVAILFQGIVCLGRHCHGARRQPACVRDNVHTLCNRVALSVLLIAAYSRPFTGEISVAPELLKQVIATEAKVDTSR